MTAPLRSAAEALAARRPPAYGVAVAAAVLSAACWGSATVMSKAVLAHMPPLTLLTVQLTASIAVLWLVVLVLRCPVRLDRSSRRASLSGLLEPGLAYTFGIVGLALTTASSAALLGAAEPLFILCLAWLLLKERVGVAMLALAAMATLGILLVIFPDTSALPGQGSLTGDLLVLAGTFFALQSLPANVAGFYLTLIPVFGLAAAFLFLGESLTALQWVGALCVIAAVAAISRVGRQ